MLGPWIEPERAQTMLLHLARGVLILAIGWGLALVLRLVLRRTLTRFVVGRAVTALLAQSVFGAILILAAITSLGSMGINVSALVASLGLGGFALGFALRDAISNLLAGVLVMVYRPFHPGEYIAVAGFEGVVDEINFRYTVLRVEGAYHLIPNQMLFTNPVKVVTEHKPT